MQKKPALRPEIVIVGFLSKRARIYAAHFHDRIECLMPRLPRISSRKLLQALQRAGFYIHHQTGGHANLRHETKMHLHVVVPRHSGDLAPKTIKSIIAQAEMTVEEFVKLL